ncbi:MAG: hypothetical protein MJ166_03745 [Clostridia bacterium]|nr:hypothetical protein [Clostridia bacterium]
MDENAITKLKKDLHRHKNKITIDSFEPIQSILSAVYESDPKLLYYVSTISDMPFIKRHTLTVEYENLDVKRNEITYIKTEDQCLNVFCKYISEYKKKIVILANKATDIIGAVKMFHNELYGFYSNYSGYSVTTYSRKSCENYAVYEYTIKYRIGSVKLKFMEQEVDAEVDRLAKLLFQPGLNDAAKAYLAHNYLATNVKYVLNRKNSLVTSYTQSAYGALIRKECVCQGYAEAFKRLMDVANIKCEVVIGKCIPSTGLHAWNIIYIEGRAYHIDVTWDVANSQASMKYFCVNDKFFTGKRKWNYSYYPKCKALDSVLESARKNISKNRVMLLKNKVPSNLI